VIIIYNITTILLIFLELLLRGWLPIAEAGLDDTLTQLDPFFQVDSSL
jgi:hypothetical protein